MTPQQPTTQTCFWRQLSGLVLILAFCISMAAPAAPVSAAGGNHLYVAPNIGVVTPCTQTNPCSLGQGMASAFDGDTIHMAAGTYPESTNFKITAGITLIGPDVTAENEPTAILDGYDLHRVVEVNVPGKTVNLINLIIQNGRVTDVDGAGIYCYGGTTLSLDHVIVRNNDLLYASLDGRSGGGIYSVNCTLSINNSTISGNTSAGWGGGLGTANGSASLNNVLITNNAVSGAHAYSGGGVSISGGTVLFDKVIIKDNTSSGGGGGLFANPISGSFTVKNSTVSGNDANGSGGGMVLYNAATIINSTFSGNHANTGGAIHLTGTTGSGDPTSQGILTINHVTMANNSATSGANINFGVEGTKLYPDNSILSLPRGSSSKNCGGSHVSIVDPDYNISSDDSCWTLILPIKNRFNTDPLLGPLQDNGGPTQTHALLEGSPAIDYVASPGASDPTQDQRGFLYNGRPDVGAFEVLEPPVIELYTQIALPFRVGQGAQVYIQILNPNSDPSVQTELAFTLTLPQNLVFDNPVVVPGHDNCGTVAAAPGGRIAMISGGTNTLFSPVTNCSLSLAVRAVAMGDGAVTATGVSSKETWIGAPPDPLNFSIAPPYVYVPLIQRP